MIPPVVEFRVRKFHPLQKLIRLQALLRSWRDLARESFCFGSEAVNASGEAVRGLVKSRVEFPPAQIRGVF